jgi:hypothetical protein
MAGTGDNYAINVRGDNSVSYLHWAADDELPGLKNMTFGDLDRQLNFNPAKVRIIFIPVSREHLLPLLRDGYADMIAAEYTTKPEFEKEIDIALPTVTGINDIVIGGLRHP